VKADGTIVPKQSAAFTCNAARAEAVKAKNEKPGLWAGLLSTNTMSFTDTHTNDNTAGYYRL